MVIEIEVLDGLRVRQGDTVTTRFPTRKTAALLGYLACSLGRDHPRDYLVELLWPETDVHSGRKSLSVALSALRRILEPPGVPAGSVLAADRFSVRLEPAAVRTDSGRFEAALERAAAAPERGERIRGLEEALALYRGPLLPGFYEDWIPREQERLAGRARRACRELSELLQEEGNLEAAVAWERRAVELDPLEEESRRRLMRLLARAGRLPEALREFQDLEGALRRELDAAPSPETQALVAELRRGPREELSRETEPSSPRQEPVRSGVHSHAAPEPRPVSLPCTWNPFFGRTEEQAWLTALLVSRQSRVVTLTGPGGAGKTRLALETAAAVRETFGEVWFVSLAELTDPALAADAIAGAVGASHVPGVQLLDELARTLRSRPGLLLLDNVEHLLPQAGATLRSLLERVPELVCLATSRCRLNLPGERELPVPPLRVPGAGSDLEALLRNESVQLFVDRAQAVRPEFRLTGENAEAVRLLCERLDGLPLAIELAAARAQVLTPVQILEQLDAGFGILSDPLRGDGPRHGSLEAAIEWSFRLLTPALQRCFAALSVFRGGWTLEAADAVVGPEIGPETGGRSILDALSRLRECSLILAEEVGGKMRYRMLEMLRQQAAAHLGAHEPELRRRHCDYYLALAEAEDPPGGRLAALEAEHANLCAGMDWCRSTAGAAEAGLRLVWAMGPFWSSRGFLREGREYATTLLAREETVAPAVRRKALSTAGAMLCSLGEYARARPYFEEALQSSEREDWFASYCAFYLGYIAGELGDHEAARRYFEESLRIKRETGEPWGVAAILAYLGNMARLEGDLPAARKYYQESLAFSRDMGDTRCAARALDCLGLLMRDERDLAAARAYHTEALAIRRKLGEARPVAASLSHLGAVALSEGRPDEARSLFEESLSIARSCDDPAAVARASAGLGRVAAVEGEFETAGALHRTALQVRAELGQPREIAESLEALAHASAACGEAEPAVRLMAAAERIRDELGIGLPADEQEERKNALEAARRRLGPEPFAAAWERGRGMTRSDAVGLARGLAASLRAPAG